MKGKIIVVFFSSVSTKELQIPPYGGSLKVREVQAVNSRFEGRQAGWRGKKHGRVNDFRIWNPGNKRTHQMSGSMELGVDGKLVHLDRASC